MTIRLALCAMIVFMFATLPYAISRAQTAAPAPVAAAATGDDGVIGTILEVEGTTTLAPQGGSPAAAAVNTPVHLNDVIATGPASRAFILLIDNTQWTLSENSKLTVDEYVFDPDDNTNNKGRYSVLQGAFQYISGLVAKKPQPDVQIETPVGSIGIRGTDITGGDLDGQYGIQVDEGAIDVKTDAGQVRVNKGEGTSLRGRAFAPARPGQWSAEHLQRFRQKVVLQHREQVQQRMAQVQERHQVMRQHYKEYMKTHPNPRMQQQQQRPQEQQKREMQEQQQKRELQEQQQKREMQEQQQKREMQQQRPGQMQPQQRREFRRQKFEQRQELRQGKREGEQAQNLGWRPREGKLQNGPSGGGGGKWKEQKQAEQQARQSERQAAQAARREKREAARNNHPRHKEKLKRQARK